MGQSSKTCRKQKRSFTLTPEQLQELEPIIRTSAELIEELPTLRRSILQDSDA